MKALQMQTLPLLPLRGYVIFPYTILNLDVGRDKSIAALEQAMLDQGQIMLATQKDVQQEDPTPDGIYQMGTIAHVKQLIKLPGGTVRVLVEGLTRARIESYEAEPGYYRVQVAPVIDAEKPKGVEEEALMRTLLQAYEQYGKLSKKVPPETLVTVANIEEPGRLADIVTTHFSLSTVDKQAILESVEPAVRLEKMCHIVTRELEVLELERKIMLRVRKQMERNQREYYLREQMKAIQKELGQKDERASEAGELRDKALELQLPEQVREQAEKEIDRLERIPPGVAEGVVVRNYLDWLLGMPWSESSTDRLDVELAERILDEDHYGLEKVKERIVEFLAVRQLATKVKSPIICLVGPPGVGKTSLARSVARALDRKFARISLGGVRDEAEIRGHRRTYVGAMPGRIIQAIRQAGTHNPVFLLDEIDKMSTDFRGDPSAALLEVLDPEQNATFTDHYLEIPFDLSSVLFITTANTAHAIPRALLDRMEVLDITSYTEEEKWQIAWRHLLPKQLAAHGLKSNQLSVSEGAVRKIIREYTREAGVRQLERELAAICRKVAKEVVKQSGTEASVTVQNLRNYLGRERFRYNLAEQRDQIGVATALVWTEVGGDTVSVEVTVMPGKGNLILTGQLGDVMRESAQAANSYVRSRVADLGVETDFYLTRDVHIHVPEGAIPKDGPSAGITMATALASALSSRPVCRDVAMTGEVTLRGRVLPIGGFKEKALAAHRAGIKTVVLPTENRRDLDELPRNVRRQLSFVFADHMDQVLETALVGENR
ncbi:MAG TPA: endopeptidase La [Firmicutes bacterium]|nr:endopeptidase La [Bacillota bacterium]